MGLVLYALGEVRTKSYTYLPPSITVVTVDAIATFICPLTLLGNVTVKGVDFEATFTVRNEDSSALNLTGYTGEAKIKKHPAATKYNSFIVTFPNRVNGQIKVALASTATTAIEGGRYVYDLVLTSPNAYKTRPIQGNVLVIPGVT